MAGKESQQGFQSSREAWIHRAGPLIRLAVEKAIVGTEVEYPSGFKPALKEAIAEMQDPKIFLAVRHHSHPDGFIIGRLTLDLKAMVNEVLPPEKQTAGFFMPLAQSLEEGQQDRPVMQVYQEIKPALRKFGLVPAPIVRTKDVEKYKMQTDEDEELRMRELINEGYNGVMLFPEGTTEGGRTDSSGKVIGMVPFERNAIKRTYLFLKRNTGSEVIFIPAATFGGREMLNPDSKQVSPVILARALTSPYPHLASIRVGMPIRSDQGEAAELLKGRDRDALNNFFGGKVAELLPNEHEQGVYAPYVKAA